jgi:hypothetical protein
LPSDRYPIARDARLLPSGFCEEFFPLLGEPLSIDGGDGEPSAFVAIEGQIFILGESVEEVPERARLLAEGKFSAVVADRSACSGRQGRPSPPAALHSPTSPPAFPRRKLRITEHEQGTVTLSMKSETIFATTTALDPSGHTTPAAGWSSGTSTILGLVG